MLPDATPAAPQKPPDRSPHPLPTALRLAEIPTSCKSFPRIGQEMVADVTRTRQLREWLTLRSRLLRTAIDVPEGAVGRDLVANPSFQFGDLREPTV